jgi:ketosteroid isomerase-like protein
MSTIQTTMTDNGKFLRKFNQALANNDMEFIQKNISEDITWVITGQKIVKGKENFMNEIMSTNDKKGFDLKIDNIITHGDSAAVDGTISTIKKPGKTFTYAFCDIYSLSGFKNPKIKKIISYLIQVSPSH